MVGEAFHDQESCWTIMGSVIIVQAISTALHPGINTRNRVRSKVNSVNHKK